MRKTRKVTILETRGKYCAGGERKVPWKHIERAPNGGGWEAGGSGRLSRKLAGARKHKWCWSGSWHVKARKGYQVDSSWGSSNKKA